MLRAVGKVSLATAGTLVVGEAIISGNDVIQYSRGPQPIEIPSEWGFSTRKKVVRAERFRDQPDKRIEYYEQALNSIIDTRTNLSAKSDEWLGGYADLLRSLAIAKHDAQAPEAEVLEPLKAAATIPFGKPSTKAAAAALAYGLTSDPKFLSITDVPPQEINSEFEVKSWGRYEIALAKRELELANYENTLSRLLRFHRSVGDTYDPLCFRATAGGYIAQLIWKFGDHKDARTWLEVSNEQASACNTNACTQTAEILQELLAQSVALE